MQFSANSNHLLFLLPVSIPALPFSSSLLSTFFPTLLAFLSLPRLQIHLCHLYTWHTLLPQTLPLLPFGPLIFLFLSRFLPIIFLLPVSSTSPLLFPNHFLDLSRLLSSLFLSSQLPYATSSFSFLCIIYSLSLSFSLSPLRVRTFPKDSALLGRDTVRALMYYALKVWSDIAPLNFHEVAGSDADIQIDFTKADHNDGYPFDGPGGTVAHAFFPGERFTAGDTHFDDDEAWTFRSPGEDLCL